MTEKKQPEALCPVCGKPIGGIHIHENTFISGLSDNEIRLHALCEEQKRLLEMALNSMRDAVHFYKTGQGRPPSQTCLFEIDLITAHLRQHEGEKHD